MPDTDPAQPSLATRAGSAARSALSTAAAAPQTTAVITSLIVFHIWRTTVGAGAAPLSALCLAAKPILTDPAHQARRLLLSSLAHAGWLHLGFNAFALAPMLARREAAGPGAAAELAGLVLAGNLIFLCVGATAASARPLRPYQPGCAVGISGAIFGLMVVEAAARPGASVVLAGGALAVPAAAYPVVLAVALQLLMPGLSAMGHLSGICAGYGLARARQAGLMADPWRSGGLPTVSSLGEGSAPAPSWRGRLSAWWSARAPAGGWSPLPSSGDAPPPPPPPRAVGGAGSGLPPAAAAAAAAEARAAAAAGGGGR